MDGAPCVPKFHVADICTSALIHTVFQFLIKICLFHVMVTILNMIGL
jgi:hypothetical protein